jgi:hypothetical protein
MRSRVTILLMLLSLFGPCVSVAQKSTDKASSCSDWKAWLNLQPGTSPPTLQVSGYCQFPTSGYSVELAPANRKAQQASLYVLRKVVHKPEGMALQVISDVPVKYTKETAAQYETVLIKPDKVPVTVEKIY